MRPHCVDEVELTDQLPPPASRPSLNTYDCVVPAGHIGGTVAAAAQPHFAFISTASSARSTCVQSLAVMPACPIRSVHDWLSALKLSRNVEPEVRYVVSARYWTFAAFTRPIAVTVCPLNVPPSTISANA